MSKVLNFSPLEAENFHAVDAAAASQTIAESKIDSAIDMGLFIVHHGTRYGAPIVIAEHKDQQADQLSGIWYATEGAQ
jgi:hypothetical protein